MDIYSLCNQTVTLYHKQINGKAVCRTVIENSAYFEIRRNHKLEKLGLGASTSALIILPVYKIQKHYVPSNEFSAENQDTTFTICAGDIIVRGIGIEIQDSKDLFQVLPANYPESVTVSSISCVRGLNGEIMHIEVG